MQPENPEILAEAQKPLVCANKSDCDLYWQRAQAYINKHSAFRIDTVTDTVLSTYQPSTTSREVGYNLTRIPRADGTATIDVAVVCNERIMGCSPTATEETVSLKRFVQSGKD